VIKLELPSLADRREDIPLLVEHFVERCNVMHAGTIRGVSESAMTVLMRYAWPGNVRELENAIEHAFVLCRQDRIELRHLPAHIRPSIEPILSGTGRTLREIEKITIEETLRRHQGRRMAAARELGIDKNTLRRKIQRLGISKTLTLR
jgi:DNA-binding NtrC family response regulator